MQHFAEENSSAILPDFLCRRGHVRQPMGIIPQHGGTFPLWFDKTQM
jgi:hypothetical protein